MSVSLLHYNEKIIGKIVVTFIRYRKQQYESRQLRLNDRNVLSF